MCSLFPGLPVLRRWLHYNMRFRITAGERIPKHAAQLWKGSHQSQRCLGAETGGQSHPHCAPVVACIKAHRGYPRVGSKPAIRAGCCLSGGENRQQRPQQLGQFRGAPQARRGPGSVWESVSGADSFPLGEGPSSSCLRTGSLAWRSSLHHRGFGSPGGWEMFCLPRSNTFWKWQSHVWLWVSSVGERAARPWIVLGALLRETEGSREPCRGLSEGVTWSVCHLICSQVWRPEAGARSSRGWVEWGLTVWGR